MYIWYQSFLLSDIFPVSVTLFRNAKELNSYCCISYFYSAKNFTLPTVHCYQQHNDGSVMIWSSNDLLTSIHMHVTSSPTDRQTDRQTHTTLETVPNVIHAYTTFLLQFMSLSLTQFLWKTFLGNSLVLIKALGFN